MTTTERCEECDDNARDDMGPCEKHRPAQATAEAKPKTDPCEHGFYSNEDHHECWRRPASVQPEDPWAWTCPDCGETLDQSDACTHPEKCKRRPKDPDADLMSNLRELANYTRTLLDGGVMHGALLRAIELLTDRRSTSVLSTEQAREVERDLADLEDLDMYRKLNCIQGEALMHIASVLPEVMVPNGDPRDLAKEVERQFGLRSASASPAEDAALAAAQSRLLRQMRSLLARAIEELEGVPARHRPSLHAMSRHKVGLRLVDVEPCCPSCERGYACECPDHPDVRETGSASPLEDDVKDVLEFLPTDWTSRTELGGKLQLHVHALVAEHRAARETVSARPGELALLRKLADGARRWSLIKASPVDVWSLLEEWEAMRSAPCASPAVEKSPTEMLGLHLKPARPKTSTSEAGDVARKAGDAVDGREGERRAALDGDSSDSRPSAPSSSLEERAAAFIEAWTTTSEHYGADIIVTGKTVETGLAALLAVVRRETIEACANVCDGIATRTTGVVAERCATEIRSTDTKGSST